MHHHCAAHSFSGGWEYTTYFHVPSFDAWLRDRPSYASAFRWHRQMLRHLGSAAPRRTEKTKPWVLKTPFYVPMLADLVEEYPDAKVVMTHRRPVRVPQSPLLPQFSSFILLFKITSTHLVWILSICIERSRARMP